MKKKFNLEKNFISVVAYTKNDSVQLKNFLSKITTLMSENFEHFEIIIVDDSGKSTAKNVITEFAKQSNTGGSLSVVEMGHPQGVELAMNAGVDLSIGDFIIEFDSVYIDYPLNTVMAVYRKALENNDIVAATPNSHKKLSSRIFYRLFNRHSNIPEPLGTETFFIISRRAINRVNNMNAKIPYRKAVYANCGLSKKIIVYSKVANSKHKNSYKYRKSIAIDSLILFTDVAYKFAIIMSFIMMVLLIGTFIYALVFFLSGQAIAGWTTTMLLLSFAFFGLFAIFTIVIKYLSIILKLIFERQSYIIKSTDRFVI